MSKSMRIFFAVLTAATTLVLLAGTIACLFVKDNAGGHMYMVSVVCGLLTALFGAFVYHDYKYFTTPVATTLTVVPPTVTVDANKK